MKLFHGSDVIVDFPKIIQDSRPLDFGSGFYTTSNEEQARVWASIIAFRRYASERFISVYDFDIETAKTKLKIIKFEKPDERWLDFICLNRSGKYAGNYDIAIGPVANDKVYQVVSYYENGTYDKQEALKRLKVVELYNQVLFHTKESLRYLKFQKAIEVQYE